MLGHSSDSPFVILRVSVLVARAEQGPDWDLAGSAPGQAGGMAPGQELVKVPDPAEETALAKEAQVSA
jgi:hypothetical protein